MGKQVGFGDQKASHAADNMESGWLRSTDTSPSRPAAARRKAAKAPSSRLTLAASLVGAAFLFCAYVLFTTHKTFSLHTVTLNGMHGMRRFGDGTAHTLVIYVYAHSDVEYAENLRYLLEFGVKPDDGCDYLIVVQEGKGVLSTQLPPLPSNVHAVPHPNECYDWGTFGWAIETRVVDTSRYSYIIFLNSSVRGPFLPPYWPQGIHWSQVLTQRITDTTKLVGATISCEGANKGGTLEGEMRRNPHVQSYVVATDQIGLGLLQQDGSVLQCYKDIHDAIWYAELGSSAAILRAGYNIDSLMLRYQGVDWRDKANWGCNAGINPYAEHMYDGINISPFEVMFVKVKEFLLDARWATATSAKKYTTWARHGFNLTDNEYNAMKAELRNMKILNMRARGSACFDFEFYKAHNPDLPVWGPATIWEHFVTNGQHEGRVFRFRCKPGAVEYASPPPSPKPPTPPLPPQPPQPPPALPPPSMAMAQAQAQQVQQLGTQPHTQQTQQAGAEKHASAAEEAAAQAAAAAKAAADAAVAAQAAAAAAQQEQRAAATQAQQVATTQQAEAGAATGQEAAAAQQQQGATASQATAGAGTQQAAGTADSAGQATAGTGGLQQATTTGQHAIHAGSQQAAGSGVQQQQQQQLAGNALQQGASQTASQAAQEQPKQQRLAGAAAGTEQ